ncbi:uncharacterized protein LOC143605583 [Bidens hawaiensis]|uniref:uncharacterized protein LOC143605583 n=1 Tax=Bidens hawaiensis TaxID=980011 RepID=UPI00404954FC
MVYLGTEPGTKAYRMYDPVRHQIHVSRDVIFNEKQGWNWSKSGENSAENLVVNLEQAGNVINLFDENTPSEISQNSPNNTDFSSNISQNSPNNTDFSQNSTDLSPNSTQNRPNNTQFSPNSTEISPSSCKIIPISPPERDEGFEDELFLTQEGEPTSYAEASEVKERDNAMNEEIASIERNKTWALVDKPKGFKAIGLKWVYKIKKDAMGRIVKYKARLVAKGYVKKFGVDFNEVFALVARIETVRLLLALAAREGWEVHHLDVKSAFLHGELDETVYVSQPEDSSTDEILKFNKQMEEQFEMSNLGLFSFYLEIEVSQSETGIEIKQETYAKKILKETNMEIYNPTKCPLEPSTKLSKDEKGKPVDATV